MSDDEFLRAFEECTVARKEWTHEAHVRMAWLYLTRIESDAEVFERVRCGIKKLNSAFIRRMHITCRPSPWRDGNGKLTGYHETITVAFVTVIAARIRPGEDFAAFRERNPDMFDRSLTALLRYYAPERLFSPLAKAELLEPDREPLPTIPT